MQRLALVLLTLLITAPVVAAEQEKKPEEAKLTAELLFKTVEKNLMNAVTLRVKFDAFTKGSSRASTATGEIFLSGRNRLRIERITPRKNDQVRTLVISDGKDYAWRVFHPSGKARQFKTPKWAKTWITGILARVGANRATTMALMRFNQKQGASAKMPSLNRRYPIENVTDGGIEHVDGKKARVIEYNVGTSTIHVKLWVELETQLPLRREVVTKRGRSERILTETYSDITINEPGAITRFDISEVGVAEANPASGESN